MAQRIRVRMAALVLAGFLSNIVPASPLRAEDNIEKAGVATALTAGNVIFIPLKTALLPMNAIMGALSFVLSGGNEELTKQIWSDTLTGPYVITPELAKKAIGERPELNVQ